MASFLDRISTSFSKGLFFSLFLVLFFTHTAGAQSNKDTAHVVQISGKVITDQDNKPVGIPYAVVAVVGTRRGTFSDFNGFFSIGSTQKPLERP